MANARGWRVETKLKGALSFHLMAEIALNFFPSSLALFVPSFVQPSILEISALLIYIVYAAPFNFILFYFSFFSRIHANKKSLWLLSTRIFSSSALLEKVSTNLSGWKFLFIYIYIYAWYNVRSKEASRSYVGFLYIYIREVWSYLFSFRNEFEIILHFTSVVRRISRNRVIFFNASPRRATIRGWIMNKTRKITVMEELSTGHLMTHK